ncbi:hypothetical protein DFH07DRAFT_166651 [Mycena maculata]|uniref:Homeobox domain-containing protein n=1 Tax=Mycena maculata TaxID=230809 RepID=A0AAD7JVB0_9AGAR|nr:hypothetical protein DFH07DRAFT_166651 [Mycena maculata]
MSNRDDRHYNIHRARTPAADQSGVFFQTGQGGRTLLPPISSAFPISHFPVPPHSSQYTQPRSSPRGFDYGQSYNNQWQPNNTPMTAPQPAFAYYDDPRYSAQPYPAVYAPRSATVAPGVHQSDHRKLPPLSTAASGRDERWTSSYPTPPFNGSPNSHIRSPTASYPASYTTAYPASNNYDYHVNDPRYVSALSPQLMANDPRAVSPYGRGSSHASPPTPPPISPIGSDEPAVKKKRKRADAAQLRVLNETYARTAFPSTEERLALAKALDMSPRSVQIWFQNKRQSMRQTNRQSSTAHQSFSLSPDEHIIDDMDYESSMSVAGTSRSSTSRMPSSSHRHPRSQEDVIDPRKWPRAGY